MKTKNEVTHTPTPWAIGHELGNSFSIVRNLNDRDLLPIAEATYTRNYNKENRDVAKENAAFIVRAVNSHEALLEAAKRLDGVLNAIERGQLKPVGSVLAEYREQVRLAIAQAEKGA